MSDEPELFETAVNDDEPIGTAFSRMIASGKDFAQAEIDRQKARAALAGSGIAQAVLFFGVAVVLSLSAIVALLVGLILVLMPYLTAAGATAAVVGGTLLVAVILAMMGRARLSRLSKALKP